MKPEKLVSEEKLHRIADDVACTHMDEAGQVPACAYTAALAGARAILEELGVAQTVSVPQEAAFWRGITLFGVHFDCDVRKGAILVRAKDRTA